MTRQATTGILVATLAAITIVTALLTTATLAKDWMGVDPSLVLPGDPRPLGLT